MKYFEAISLRRAKNKKKKNFFTTTHNPINLSKSIFVCSRIVCEQKISLKTAKWIFFPLSIGKVKTKKKQM